MRKQILILSTVFMSLTVFGQKEALKSAEKALKSNDFATATQVLEGAESSIASADQKTAAKFYYLKAKALYQNGASGIDVKKTGAALWQLINYEKETNKVKYSAE